MFGSRLSTLSRKMDPPDAVVLRCIRENDVEVVFAQGEPPDHINKSIGSQDISNISGRLVDEIEASLRHLQTLSFLDISGDWGDKRFFVNATCREFLRSCYPGNKS